MIRAAAFAAALFGAGLAQAAAPAGTLADPALEARAQALQKELRCVVCQSESLDESGAPLAADLRRLIRERIAAGDSDSAVRRYLVARYGDFILLKPPLALDTYLLWFGPLGVLLGGGVIGGAAIIRARRRAMMAGTLTKANSN